MPEIALRMDHVYKKFHKGELHDSLRDLIPALARRVIGRREFWALQDISFELSRGQALGVVGMNGAGKSTMLKLITRIMKPTSGSIELQGKLSALIEVSAGFHPDLTGRENIYLNGTILGMRRREVEAKFDEIVDFSGLSEFLDTPVKRYSSGMYARLGFSVAAHVNPDVLLVDEVLSVGDFIFQQKCITRMKQVMHNGTTILFVSHSLKAVAEFCTSCLLLDRGRVEMLGPTEDVLKRYMNQGTKRKTAEGPATITKVTFRDESGDQFHYRSGQKAWIDVEVTARQRCPQVAIILYYWDEHRYQLTNYSSERLGYGSVSLEEGQVFSCTFELTMNFGSGIFRACVAAFRHDTETEYDVLEPAGTIYVSSESDIRGGVNCFPKVVRQELRGSTSAAFNECLT